MTNEQTPLEEAALERVKAQWRAEWEAEREAEHQHAYEVGREAAQRADRVEALLVTLDLFWSAAQRLVDDIPAVVQSGLDAEAAFERGKEPAPWEDRTFWEEFDWMGRNGTREEVKYAQGMVDRLNAIATHYDAAAQPEVITCRVLLEHVVALTRQIAALGGRWRDAADAGREGEDHHDDER